MRALEEAPGRDLAQFAGDLELREDSVVRLA